MTIIVGYRPTPEGRAALDRAIDEARRSGARLLVITGVGHDGPLEAPGEFRKALATAFASPLENEVNG